MSPGPNKPGIAPRGFTLVEAAVATAVTGALVVGMAAALTMSVGAIDRGDDVGSRAGRAGDALGSVLAEAAVATRITEATGARLALVLADRDADGFEEEVVYEWAGAGEPLTRTLNGSDVLTVLPAVADFTVGTELRAGPTLTRSGEVVLMGHDNATGGSFKEKQIEEQKWAAQYVRPTLPAAAVSWTVTGVRLRLKREGGNDGILRVRITTASGSRKPTTTVLCQVTENESRFTGSFQWVDLVLPETAAIAPGTAVCIVVEAVDNRKPAMLEYEEKGSNMPFNTHYMTSDNRGSSWEDNGDEDDMRFELRGKIITEGP